MSLLRLIARCLFASIFVIAGYQTMTEPGGRTQLVEKNLQLSDGEPMVRLNGAAMVVGGAALALDIAPRVAALGLAGLMVPTTYAGHQFWAEEDEMRKRNQQVHFLKNLTTFGALLTYALGRPSNHD